MGKVRMNRREARINRLKASEETVKEKFREERNLPPVRPMNSKQERYLEMLDSCRIIIVEGYFGTGKTYLASVVAADALRKREVDKVIVARPYVQTGKTSGFKPGSTLEKLYPYVRNILDTMKQRLGDAVFINSLKDGLRGSIEIQELESIRGRSFDERSYLLIDEAQQSTPEEMLSIITRISDNCTLVVMGDNSQKDIRGMSGLEWLIDFVQRHKLRGAGIVEFYDEDDIVRGGMVRDIAVGLIKDQNAKIPTPMSS